MANETKASGQFAVLIVLNNLASCLAIEGANVETVIQTISKFQIEIERVIKDCQPAWYKIDIADSRIIWAAESSNSQRVKNALQKLELLRKRTDKWLHDEGFSKLSFSVGMDTGHLILSGQIALGTPITTAYVLADFGLAHNSFIVSERTAAQLNLNLRSPLSFVDIEVKGLLEKHKRVAVLPMSEFA